MSPTTETGVLLSAVLAMSCACAGLLIYGSGRGFDLTDETFYLIWARDPHAYSLMIQPFGYALHPLFQLVGGDVQLYRLAGFAAAALAGALVGHSLCCGPSDRHLFSLYGAGAALSTFFPWIITPSYNSMADVGAMLTVGGVLEAFKPRMAARVASAMAIGLGMCLSAFAKPPLFAISACILLYLAFAARRARAPSAAGLALGAGLISLFVPPAEIPTIVERILSSQGILSLPNTPLRLPIKVALDGLAVSPPLIAAAVAALFGFSLPRSRWSTTCSYAAVALSLCYLASVAADSIDGSIPDFIGFAFVTLGAGYASALRQERQDVHWAAVTLLLGAPAAVALGTFNNQWFQLNFSLPFAFLGLFTLAWTDSRQWRRRTAQALAIGGPAAAMLLAAWAPYSLPSSIFDQQVEAQPPLAAGPVLVDEQTAAFLNEARGLARGSLLIDLSGTGPGVAAVLGANAPVLSWLNPAVPSSPDVVWSQLSFGQQQNAAFVVPVWPSFSRSAPAQWLATHKKLYCRRSLPEMPFWGEERTLQVWQACAPQQVLRSTP